MLTCLLWPGRLRNGLGPSGFNRLVWHGIAHSFSPFEHNGRNQETFINTDATTEISVGSSSF